MTPAVFLVTSGLLGFLVLAAGAYALLYVAARFKESRALLIAAGLAYAMLALDATGIVMETPLAPPWKLLIAASALAYLAIPPLTWRYLQYTHREEGAQL
jgi:uncharacterized membrane protein YgdD (TMEM256/DUF423 family)